MRVAKVLWAVALAAVVASWGLAMVSPEEKAEVTGEVRVLTIPIPPEIARMTIPRPEPDTLRIPPEIAMEEVIAAFKILKGGEDAVRTLIRLRPELRAEGGGTLASLQPPFVVPPTVVPFPCTEVLVTPLSPKASHPPCFRLVYLDLWQIDAFACYKALPQMCALDKAYFLDPTLGWGAPPLAGRINGWYALTTAGWYLFVAKVHGEPMIRFTAHVNGVFVGTFTVTGTGIMPILVYLSPGWNWVRFDHVAIPGQPSRGAFISLKAWCLGG